jgi:hypothetical protein
MEVKDDSNPTETRAMADSEERKNEVNVLNPQIQPAVAPPTLLQNQAPNPAPSGQVQGQQNGPAATPVDFQALLLQNDKIGQGDELKRLLKITESLKSDVDALKKVTTDKETQVRTLQPDMGQM